MKQFSRIATSLLLSLFILVSGSGLIIGKMVCLKSGYVQISANEVKDCCDEEGTATEFTDQCCAISNLTFQQQQFVGQNPLLIKASDVPSLILLPEILSSVTVSVGFSENYFSSSNPPGLITGADALPVLCVFRV
jgi:hypothetical protein